ncbi:hypothetical protein EDB92DRAFT_1265045 [Lactarius akahatsu]|uniref:Uncharacterized protein n=1 Tax=Lactarius akahatsu TaxID=416441 RepID=A0AAD4LA56_9AGAM|nr:hypothetical protein EDB92DRAFT_1265045 [Lactarius akahatsu]
MLHNSTTHSTTKRLTADLSCRVWVNVSCATRHWEHTRAPLYDNTASPHDDSLGYSYLSMAMARSIRTVWLSVFCILSLKKYAGSDRSDTPSLPSCSFVLCPLALSGRTIGIRVQHQPRSAGLGAHMQTRGPRRWCHLYRGSYNSDTLRLRDYGDCDQCCSFTITGKAERIWGQMEAREWVAHEHTAAHGHVRRAEPPRGQYAASL